MPRSSAILLVRETFSAQHVEFHSYSLIVDSTGFASDVSHFEMAVFHKVHKCRGEARGRGAWRGVAGPVRGCAAIRVLSNGSQPLSPVPAPQVLVVNLSGEPGHGLPRAN